MPRPRSSEAQNKMRTAAAEILFAEGVDGCSVEEVARRSGVAKTTIYRHYGGIDELIFDVVKQSVTAPEPVDTGTLAGDLAVILQRYLHSSRHQFTRELFVWMVQRSIQEPHLAELFADARVQPNGPTAIALRRAIERGEIPETTDIDVAFNLIQGPLFAKRMIQNAEPSPEEFDTMIKMIVAGLRHGG